MAKKTFKNLAKKHKAWTKNALTWVKKRKNGQKRVRNWLKSHKTGKNYIKLVEKIPKNSAKFGMICAKRWDKGLGTRTNRQNYNLLYCFLLKKTRRFAAKLLLKYTLFLI